MFDTPSAADLYQALLSRDARYEGRAFVGVVTTGILCRLTCPARKPKPENCQWFSSVKDGLAAGFRPCKRCHPMGPEAEGDAIVSSLLRALNADPTRRWTEADVAAAGFDPSTVRRGFQRHFGLTFLALARQSRLRQGIAGLRTGQTVTEAQLDAGFDSASGFRSAFARLFGHPPQALRTGEAGLRADWLDTPLGGMIAVADDQALHLLEFVERKALPVQLRGLSGSAGGQIGLGRTAIMDEAAGQLAEYFQSTRREFTIPMATGGSTFQRAVWAALRSIPPGRTVTYGGLAADLGRPSAARAVARANAMNRIAIIIPCHRVIGADGTLTGYAGGLWRKQALIEIEQKLV